MNMSMPAFAPVRHLLCFAQLTGKLGSMWWMPSQSLITIR